MVVRINFLKFFKGYRTFIASGLAALFGFLATVDWSGILSGHPEGGYTAIVLGVVFAVMRIFTNTAPGQSAPPPVPTDGK